MRRRALPIPTLALLAACHPGAPVVASAPPRLGSLFSDHMVLQRGVRAPVWGTAAPGERIAVSVGAQRVETTAGADGRWQAWLGPMEAGGPFELTAAGAARTTLHDVMVGEVWIASGQSNMQFPLHMSTGGEEAIAAANRPLLRLFKVPRDVADHPRTRHGGRWKTASPETARDFSAVAYHFGREIGERLGVPVGIIQSAWSGSPAEAWMSPAALRSDPAFASIEAMWAKKMAEHRAEIEAYEPQWLAYRSMADRAIEAGEDYPNPPDGPEGPHHNYYPSNLYNGMLAPLAPYAVRGFIWYQGEGNRDRAAQYRKLFPALIRDFRQLWGGQALPFLFVQLPSYGETPPEPAESDNAELREAQRMALAVPGTAMAVALDLGDPKDVHPRNKKDVAHRLALLARARVYGEDIESSGPMYESMSVEGSVIRLRFSHLGGGLVAQGGGPLVGFAISGPDGRFAWAEARIDGDSVVVSRPGLGEPRAVRYAWGNSPRANLFNAAGLPASPFRTDAPP
ncbi:MAG: sialate O-acetylesterase [Minicystis sp.]